MPRGAGLLLGFGLFAPALAQAQISPGKLSRSHAALEGSGHCLDCHERGEGPAAGKCVACHSLLGARLKAGKGLHARPEYADCKTCHVEHQGLDFDLVYWGKAGRGAFDHALTGLVLEGKHRTLTCESCHQSKFHRLGDALASGKASTNTYLGLTPACLSCHPDPHVGTKIAGRECTSCHSQTAWRPVAQFDHGTTGFLLTGRHASAACETCHDGAPPAPPAGRRVLRSVKGRECVSCHPDTHSGKLGTVCTTCHTTSSWRTEAGKMAGGAKFDHDRTGYPLRGRHVGVSCKDCHLPGRPLRAKHERCTDCHADAHYGQFAKRADRGRCESCHDVSGFVPARYALEDHQKTAYPLAGAHLAVPCDACHKKLAPQAIRALVPGGPLGSSSSPTPVFRFAATRCVSCHADPHKGEVDAHVKKGGCEACHKVDSWKTTTFDHGTTKFVLTGGHAKPPCSACHPRVDKGTARERVRFAGLSLACESCHEDPHVGQFKTAAGSVACDRCHTTTDVRATRFDHNRDSAYPLDGAHAKVACAACHPTEKRGLPGFVRYKPLGKACKDCHFVAETGEKR